MPPFEEVYQTVRLLKRQFYGRLKDNTALHTYIMQETVINTIKAIHPYAISPHKRGGFYTKVNDPTPKDPKHRKTLLGQTEADIFIKLVEWYGEKHIENLTVRDLYLKWQEYRRAIQTDENTIVRDEQRYKKYFEDTKFFDRKLTELRRSDWKEFCCQVIVGKTRANQQYDENNPDILKITRKEWGSTKCILNGMLDLAVDREYIQFNPLKDMKFEKHLFSLPKRKTAQTEVYNTSEKDSLVTWCLRKFKETNDVAYLLPVLNFYLGGRIGECVALTWDSWLDLRHLEISKSEVKDRRTNKLEIRNYTKTHEVRIIPLGKEAIKILHLIQEHKKSVKWIFARDGERLTSREANYILEKYAKEMGIKTKSSHKLRKTCGSNLRNAGFSPKQCADYLGNSEEVFLRCYSYDTHTEEETIALLDNIS